MAVHGIQVPYYHQQHHQQHRQQQQSVSVAVGDTFLFSAHAPTISSPASLGPAGAGGSKDGGGAAVVNLSPLLSDSCCVTHALPYYRCFMGAGAEEHSAQRLLSSTKSIHMSVACQSACLYVCLSICLSGALTIINRQSFTKHH